MRIGDVIALVALVITILIALIIAGNLKPVADNVADDLAGNTSASQNFNDTRDTLFTNTWSG